MAQLDVCMEIWLPSGQVFTSPRHAELCTSNEGQPGAMNTCARCPDQNRLRLASFANHLELAIMTQSAAQGLGVYESLVTLCYNFVH